MCCLGWRAELVRTRMTPAGAVCSVVVMVVFLLLVVVVLVEVVLVVVPFRIPVQLAAVPLDIVVVCPVVVCPGWLLMPRRCMIRARIQSGRSIGR